VPYAIDPDAEDWWSFFQEASTNRWIAFIPSPTEIEQRKADLQWLQACGFTEHFIASVMECDQPKICYVKRQVFQYGIREAIRRCTPLLADTEYSDGNLS